MAQREENWTFEDKPAVRESMPLMVGLVGPSASGKTYSLLRLATGAQRVSGGDIFMIDTEARRGLHYADNFKFRHVVLGAPFSPLKYLAAIEHCVKRGAKTIIVDSMSHEHEGPGGVLEWHGAECERIQQAWGCSREKAQFPAWGVPKGARRRLINSMLQMDCNFMLGFRAKDKIKIVSGKQPESLGWMPIAGEEFMYEQTVNLLLPPSSRGVPELAPRSPAQKEIFKIPDQFEGIFKRGDQLSEHHGEMMMRWMRGGAPQDAGPKFIAGGAEWIGKPLRAAPLDVLTRYKTACGVGLAKKSGADADALRKHIADVDAVLDELAQNEFAADLGSSGDGYSANEAESEAMAGAND